MYQAAWGKIIIIVIIGESNLNTLAVENFKKYISPMTIYIIFSMRNMHKRLTKLYTQPR